MAGLLTPFEIAIPVAVSPGTVLLTFDNQRELQPGCQQQLLWFGCSGQAGDVITVWTRPAIALATENQLTLATVTLTAAVTDFVRGCYSIPNGVNGSGELRVPWVVGITRTGAGNAFFRGAYAQNEPGNR